MDGIDAAATPYGTGGLDPTTGNVVPTSPFDPWAYREDVPTGADVTGYKVEAVDGGIGKVDSASTELHAACLVVDTGPWIFGKKVVLPAGVVNHINHDERRVYVDRTKEQIKDAPEYDEDGVHEPAYRERLGAYYGSTY